MADQSVLRRLHVRVRQNGILNTMQVHKREVQNTIQSSEVSRQGHHPHHRWLEGGSGGDLGCASAKPPTPAEPALMLPVAAAGTQPRRPFCCNTRPINYRVWTVHETVCKVLPGPAGLWQLLCQDVPRASSAPPPPDCLGALHLQQTPCWQFCTCVANESVGQSICLGHAFSQARVWLCTPPDPPGGVSGPLPIPGGWLTTPEGPEGVGSVPCHDGKWVMLGRVLDFENYVRIRDSPP